MSLPPHALPSKPLSFVDFEAVRTLLWVNKDAKEAFKQLPINPLEVDVHHYPTAIRHLVVDLTAEIFLQRNDVTRALLLFKKYERHEDVMLCLVAKKSYKEAEAYWQTHGKRLPNENHAWAETLVATVKGNLTFWPTFLQLRNRLESDVYRFGQLKAYDALDNLLAYVVSFAMLNPEVYKLAGRALMFNGFQVQARPLLEQAIRNNPIDAESYFHMAQFYISNRLPHRACLLLRQVLLMNPTYTPAHALLKNLG
jgi:tetratricopeptide (TPR) repeat protein